MEIVEEDLVDWEPLIIRFNSRKRLSRKESLRLATFVQNWFDKTAAENPNSWRTAKEWNASIEDGGSVVARCEFMPPEGIPLLAAAVGVQFPVIDQLRLGYPLPDQSQGRGSQWTVLPGGRLDIDGKVYSFEPFCMSFKSVSIGQFEKFLHATNYIPVPDVIREYPGFVIENTYGQLGRSSHIPAIGVTLDDAVAYCDWAQVRLPTEPELAYFFDYAVRDCRKFDWAFACWTSTSISDDIFAARNGPYVAAALDWPSERHRLELHRHHYEWPTPPSFRVVMKEARTVTTLP